MNYRVHIKGSACVCIPEMLSMLKLLPFRDSGSLEILKPCKTHISNIMTVAKNIPSVTRAITLTEYTLQKQNTKCRIQLLH